MMPSDLLQQVLRAFGIAGATAEPFGSGLINHTWKVTGEADVFILQKINQAVFREPQQIADNIRQIARHLQQHHPDYLFVAPLPSKDGADLVQVGDGYYRIFPFVPGARTMEVVHTPAEAFEAAAQFGRFTKLLSAFDANRLQLTIPDFHNLSLRYRQFETALQQGDRERIRDCAVEIEILQEQAGIVTEYETITAHPQFRRRVTHHDTKISNVLFDAAGKGLCVIDLDTVMPGYFISDVGDMMRTYLSPVSEEEMDLSKIEVRASFYEAIVKGYYSEMKEELSKAEKEHFFYAGQFMVYMQALRFLTDHLNNDKYYGARYPNHNKLRAQNQVVLLEKLNREKDKLLQL